MYRTILLVGLISLMLTGCGKPHQHNPHDGLRIIAMAPNTAEILYALGMSNQIVGVNRFCTYPPDVTNKPSVGGMYDPNMEQIVTLQPDLVIGLTTQKEIATQLFQLNIRFVGVAHETIHDILQSIQTLGAVCGKEAEAQRLIQSLEQSAQSHPSPESKPKPRVLVCVGHDEPLSRMYVAAKNTLYDELIDRAGGQNACTLSGGYPEISPESLLIMNPDIVIDIGSMSCSSNSWKPYRAVIMTNDYASIPGPRFTLLLQDFIRVIHE